MSKTKDPKQKQVSLAGVAGGTSHQHKKKSKSRMRPWIIWLCLLLVVVTVFVVYKVNQRLSAGPSLAPREFVEYTYTADDMVGDVAYYALGIAGDEPGGRLDAMAIMCFDRENDKISVLQMPVSTYIEKGDTFATSVAGDVWSTPLSRRWCDTCRCFVAADAVTEGKHTLCGTETAMRVGSATTDFARLFNTQLGLPVDNYLVIPRKGLAQLVDALDGVTVKLDKELNVGGIKYAAGTATLSGEAAVYYAVQYDYNGSAASDTARMQRQRQVFAGILDRLSDKRVSDLFSEDDPDVLSTLMNGAYPVRFDTTSFGKARLMGKSNDSAADNVRYTHALAEFLYDVGQIDLQNAVCCILPGQTAKKGSLTVYSAYRAETLALLNEQMNPYGLTLDDTTVGIQQLKKTEKSNAYIAALSTVAVEQTPLENTEEE